MKAPALITIGVSKPLKSYNQEYKTYYRISLFEPVSLDAYTITVMPKANNFEFWAEVVQNPDTSFLISNIDVLNGKVSYTKDNEIRLDAGNPRGGSMPVIVERFPKEAVVSELNDRLNPPLPSNLFE